MNQSRIVPDSLWDELQSVSVAQDATDWGNGQRADTRYPMVTSVDIENGFVFAAAYFGFQIWDIRTTPQAPVKLSTVDGWSGQFPSWVSGNSEVDQLIRSIDAPAGDDSLAGVGGINPSGFSIWNTSNKSAPTNLYQDAPSKQVSQIYAATIGGRAFAFVAVDRNAGAGPTGIFTYDMTAARSYNRCLEDVSIGIRNCPGVYVGQVFNGNSQYVHGMQFGQRHFIVRSAGQSPPYSVDIFDVTSPASPVPVVTGFSGAFTAGVALWSQGSTGYLAVRTSSTVRIYDVTSCLNNGCSALPSPIRVVSVAPVPESDFWKSIDFSRSGTTPFLFIGNHDLCHQGEDLTIHTEYLFDMTDPANPRDVSPNRTTVDAGETVNYWSWFYSDYTRGFSATAPRGGKFNGPYFYRAALTLFDVHKWVPQNTPPVAGFTWSPQGEIYVGDPVTFTDTSTGGPTSWSWTFQDGSPPTSSANPVTGVTFGSAGLKPVSLTVSNNFPPASQATASVTVLNPAPAIASVAASPSNGLICQPITFTASGVTGKPPRTLTWQILDTNDQPLPSPPAPAGTNPTTWDSTGAPSGDYKAKLTVSNGSGSFSKVSPLFTLNPLLPLPGNGTFTPLCGPPTSGSVQCQVTAQGATRWCWDWDGNQTFPDCTNDPASGPTRSHTYTSIGQRNVRVKVSNCQDLGGTTSSPALVDILQVAPLTVSFQAQGCFPFCAFGINQQINFDVTVAGSPDQVEFDWDGNGSFEDSRPGSQFSAPVTLTHSYSAAGQYSPKVRLIRGAETPVVGTHSAISISGSPPPASLSISGPSSGNIGQALSFTASASNCTASAGGWSWSSGGGTLTGSGSQVTISWSTAGTKAVSVANTGCPGASGGTKSVSIGDGGGGGGGGGTGSLVAAFTFTPASPNPGQSVSFDGSTSTGGQTGYLWTFGDGQTTSGNTPTTSHTYQAAGAYTVRLEVSKSDPNCPLSLCSAAVSKTVTVTGGPAPLVASFDSSGCISDFAGTHCAAEVGQAVSFTSTTANATSHSWSFGDTGTASGVQVSHTWTQPGTFVVQLTVGDGRTTAAASKTFIVTGEPVASTKSVILPWIAQTRGALVQSSDLYLLNPAATAMNVTLTFLKRGTPEANPPKVTRTIQPGATLFVADVLQGLFNRENVAGFITVKVDQGSVEPIITSFNTTVQDNGAEFGQTVPGISMSTTGAAATTPGASQVQSLVGLNDNNERLAYFGISNPGAASVSYTLRFFDHTGRQIGTPHDFTLGQLGQRQFQLRDIRELFGVDDEDDYRIEIRRSGDGLLFPYGANLRTGSEDPSFVGVGTSAADKVFLLGALSTPGLNHSTWLSDVVISNTANEVVLTDVTFTGTGVSAQPTTPVHLTLLPGETRRLSDVIGQQWGIRNTVGVVTLESDAPGGVFPIVQGESYENTTPSRRFGQSMAGMTEAQAAGPNAAQYLVGLRQDATHRTTLWIHNPGNVPGVYDIIYLGLDGQELGRLENVAMLPGKIRQFAPSQHQIPAAGVTGGFTVQVRVRSGKVLAAAQVVNNATNDPAYIQGETR